jgi:hypothetical protein
MKKYLLLLFLSFSFYGQTYQDVSDLIDLNLASGQNITAVKHRAVEHALLNYIQANLFQSGDIKVINCDLAYYTANFETSGLGKNLRTGWAVCNGANGTPNIAGKVIVGYGLAYSTFGAIGGSKDAVVIEHTHDVGGYHSGSGSTIFTSKGLDSGTDVVYSKTLSTGVSGTDRNMQPYIVQLYIMKL